MDPLNYLLLTFTVLMGACIGSFLNVVAYRLPLGLSLSHPPSTCPKCNTRLKWYDNIPVLGWVKLLGRCRFCKNPISIRYPIVEALTALLFAGAYLVLFYFNLGPETPLPPAVIPALPGLPVLPPPRDIVTEYPILLLYCAAIAILLAMSLIDLETFTIPMELCLLLAAAGFLVHGLLLRPGMLGALAVTPFWAIVTMGATVGLIASILLLWRKVLPRSFPDGDPLLEVDYKLMAAHNAEARKAGKPIPYDEPFPTPMPRHTIRAEMTKELFFLIPPAFGALVAAVAYFFVPGAVQLAEWLNSTVVLSTLFPSVLGALVGGAMIWLTRIAGTIGLGLFGQALLAIFRLPQPESVDPLAEDTRGFFVRTAQRMALGRVAMGMGDIHLHFAIGAVIGVAGAFASFFFAPFAGLAFGLYGFITGKQREIPYGPYLAAAALTFMVMDAPVTAYLKLCYDGMVVLLSF